MTTNYGYYLPLAQSIYEQVRFLDISPKTTGIGVEEKQATDTAGNPKWTISALVKLAGGNKPETEVFTLTATQKVAEEINAIPELTPVRLVGLSAGKWSRLNSDRTEWTFQVAGIEIEQR